MARTRLLWTAIAIALSIAALHTAAPARAADGSEPGSGTTNEARKGAGGLDWVEKLFRGFRHVPASRLRLAESRPVPDQKEPVALVVCDFTYLGPRGEEEKAKAKLYLPDLLREGPEARVPLFFVAGYEATDPVAISYVKRGCAVVSHAQVDPNPMVRTANPDLALLHIARSLPFVEDSKVVIGGGSAGGYMTLMLAAETFPLAGAAPDVPPINWGYNGAYIFEQQEKVSAARDAKQGREVPFLAFVTSRLEGAKQVYGTDYGDLTWFQYSPLGHLSTITCPVSVLWSTADVLVPMNQVGDRWVQPFDPKSFPEGFTMDPSRLTRTREGRLRLTDVLPDSDYEVFILPAPKGDDKPTPATASPRPLELPASTSKRWSVIILDEGPPGQYVGHFKNPSVVISRDEFLRRVTTGRIPASQLTAPKLERLMDRYAQKEWLPSKLKHLDDPESDRADVLRGLKTYVTSDPENAKTFAQLYQQLPLARRVLEPEVLQKLVGIE